MSTCIHFFTLSLHDALPILADEVETEIFQIGPQVRLVVLVRYYLRAGRHGGLNPRLGLQALLGRVAGEQTGSQHDLGVGGVGARGDRRDRDAAVVEFVGGTVRLGDRYPLGGASDVFADIGVRGLAQFRGVAV